MCTLPEYSQPDQPLHTTDNSDHGKIYYRYN